MPYSSDISKPIVAIRTADADVVTWIKSIYHEPVDSEISESTRLAIYGEDFTTFLKQDVQLPVTGWHSALCLSKSVEIPYLDLFRHNVRHIVYPAIPFAEAALRLAIGAAKFPATPGMCSDFLEFDPAPHFVDSISCPVISTSDSDRLWTCVNTFLQDHSFGDELNQSITLALKEAVTNATFHAFREPGSHSRKYIPETFHGLYDLDAVQVNLNLTEDWLCVEVSDNSGSLGPLSVANSLDRHHSSRGLMDTRGRGFYLIQSLSDRLVVCVRRRKQTSVKMYFLREKRQQYAARHFELIDY